MDKPYVVVLVYSNGIVDLMFLDDIIIRNNINKIKSYNKTKVKQLFFIFGEYLIY